MIDNEKINCYKEQIRSLKAKLLAEHNNEKKKGIQKQIKIRELRIMLAQIQ